MLSPNTYVCAAPFAYSSGPQDARIALVGEAHGKTEALAGKPFMGASGQELTRMLAEGGLRRADCFLTNVVAFRPQDNKFETLCCSKAGAGPGYPAPPLSQGKYLKPMYFPELERLYAELSTVRPNLVVALGATACWALLGSARISSLRGSVAWSHPALPNRANALLPVKTLPTYHPAAVLRQWNWRPICVVDFMKARREAASAELHRPEREIIVDPSLRDIEDWITVHANSAEYMAVDIETYGGQITCIGFATSPAYALVVPFCSPDGTSFWSPEDEVLAWTAVKRILNLPAQKVFQNGLYDLQYLYRIGFRPRNCTEDTMLLHHSLYPELQKGLGFLGSIYTNESSWKLLRHQRSDKGDKRDE